MKNSTSTVWRSVAAPYLLDSDGTLLRNGVVRFAADGTVLGVESCDRIDSLPQTEYHNGILIPGMTNAPSKKD